MRDLHEVISVFPSDSEGRPMRCQWTVWTSLYPKGLFVFRDGRHRGWVSYLSCGLCQSPLPDNRYICRYGAALTSEAIPESLGSVNLGPDMYYIDSISPPVLPLPHLLG